MIMPRVRKNEPEAPLAPVSLRTVRTLRTRSGDAIRIVTEPVEDLDSPKQEQAAKCDVTEEKAYTSDDKDTKPEGADTPKKKTETDARKKPKAPPPKTHPYLSLPLGDKILFLKHLSVMLEAGIPVEEALEVLLDQMSNKNLKTILKVALADISDGYQLNWSLGKFPKAFDPFLTNVIGVGEESGTLVSQLRYLAEQLEKKKALESSVRNALFYPIIVFLGSLAIGAYLAFGLLPKLIPMFLSLKIQLPVTTRMLIWVSRNGAAHWMSILMVSGVLIVVAALLVRIREVRYMLHTAALSMPVFGRMTRDLQLVQLSRVLGTLLASGLHIVPAIKVTRSSATNLVYEKQLEKIADAVERGETLSASLRQYPYLFSKTAVSMVGVGERTGRLSISLLSFAEFEEREVDNMTKNLSALIEPILLMVVGLIVGFVALSIITPIYQLTQGLSR
jgi:type IV pilus assembly protein PilC